MPHVHPNNCISINVNSWQQTHRFFLPVTCSRHELTNIPIQNHSDCPASGSATPGSLQTGYSTC